MKKLALLCTLALIVGALLQDFGDLWLQDCSMLSNIIECNFNLQRRQIENCADTVQGFAGVVQHHYIEYGTAALADQRADIAFNNAVPCL